MANSPMLPKAFSAASGSHIVTEHTERTMRLYGVFESELRALSMFNAITAIFTSAGTGLLSFLAGVLIDAAKDGVEHPEAAHTICWVCGVLAVACFSVAFLAFKWRRSALTTIMTESRPRP